MRKPIQTYPAKIVQRIFCIPQRLHVSADKKEFHEVITICDNLLQLKYVPTLPMVFTEQGVSMLSSVLKSKRAVKVNISIMRAFVQMR